MKLVTSKDRPCQFRNGHWEWNNEQQTLVFVMVEATDVVDTIFVPDPHHRTTGLSGIAYHALNYRDTMNEVELVAFERAERRKSQYHLPPVITLDDVKDLAVFFVVETLPPQFLTFFQTTRVNHWLRAVIVYMHFFIQTCEQLMETVDLLHGPDPVDRPPHYKQMSQDLAELRFIVGRQHSCLVMTSLGSGGGSSHSNRQTRDVLFFELLLQLGIRIVWITLSRRHLSIIDTEMNRIFRTEAFSMKFTKRINDEVSQNFVNHKTRDILYGNDIEGLDCFGNLKESQTERQRVMLQNSPVLNTFQDLENNDLLQLGMPDFQTNNKRLDFLAKCFYASEEELAMDSIEIGILGQDRNNYDISLHHLDKKKEDMRSVYSFGGGSSINERLSSRPSPQPSSESLTSLLQEEP